MHHIGTVRHIFTESKPTNLILERPAEIHVELVHTASVQVVDRQHLISFVEEALGLRLAGPSADPATGTRTETRTESVTVCFLTTSHAVLSATESPKLDRLADHFLLSLFQAANGKYQPLSVQCSRSRQSLRFNGANS